MKVRYLGQYAQALAGKCPHCQHISTFEQHGFYERPVGPLHVVTFFSCAHCSGPVVIECPTWTVERVGSVMPGARRRFPSPEYEHAVPSNIAEVMRQVYAAIEVKAWMLVGMGVRLVVELTSAERCTEHGVKLDQSLKARLRDLQHKYPALEGPIQLADTIRLLGNEVAHDDTFICGPEESAVAVELLEEMLEALYVLPARRARLLSALPNKKDALK